MLAGAGVTSAATVTADFNSAGSIGGGTAAGAVRNSSVGGDANTDGLLGFNGFSSTNFAVLGDNTGNLVSDGFLQPSNPTSGDSSLSFNISLSTVSDLAVSFRYRFRGWDLDLVNSDAFQVTLTGQPTLFNASSSFLGSIGSPLTFADGTFNAVFGALAAGSYTLSFVLNEAAGDLLGPLTNTAVAIDDVSMVSTPVPVPAAIWLFGSAIAGIVGIGRRRREIPFA
jgi:hypothetical protein